MVFYVYKLWTHLGDECYIGATHDISERYYHHRSKHNKTSSKKLIEKYGRNNVFIEVIETVYGTREELYKRENIHIQLTPDCVNIRKNWVIDNDDYDYESEKDETPIGKLREYEYCNNRIHCYCGFECEVGDYEKHRNSRKHKKWYEMVMFIKDAEKSKK